MKGIDHLAQNIEPSFTHKDIEIFRKHIVYELYTGLKKSYGNEYE